jgi:hypothetical protein
LSSSFFSFDVSPTPFILGDVGDLLFRWVLQMIKMEVVHQLYIALYRHMAAEYGPEWTYNDGARFLIHGDVDGQVDAEVSRVGQFLLRMESDLVVWLAGEAIEQRDRYSRYYQYFTSLPQAAAIFQEHGIDPMALVR